MSSPTPPDQQDIKSTAEKLPYVRPRDASTLILVRRDRSSPQILMGKRSNKHAFMPDKYVFPGGGVDPTDARAPVSTELDSEQEQVLLFNSRRKPRALPLAAIRETFEETGLIIGHKAKASSKGPKIWQQYLENNALPALNELTLIGRAITPTQSKRRFDARFFMAEAEKSLLDERPANTSPELVDVQWVDIKEAYELDLPSVTRYMIGEVKHRLEQPKDEIRPVFLKYGFKGGRFERI